MPITAFLAVSSKAAGFFVLLNLVNGPFSRNVGISSCLYLDLLPHLPFFFGNLARLCSAEYLKRMLGLSGVAHAGYFWLR